MKNTSALDYIQLGQLVLRKAWLEKFVQEEGLEYADKETLEAYQEAIDNCIERLLSKTDHPYRKEKAS